MDMYQQFKGKQLDGSFTDSPDSAANRPRRAAALLMVALPIFIASCSMPPPPTPLMPPPSPSAPVVGLPPACALQYNALLDLADLARRYGPSAGMFLDPLGDMFDQLDHCLSGGSPPRSSVSRDASLDGRNAAMVSRASTDGLTPALTK